MGYSTDFFGKLTLNKQLTDEDSQFIKDLNRTRRMKRNIKGYGVDGEFYVNDKDRSGQSHTPDIIDYNEPPSTQPGLWFHLVPTDDDRALEWDGGEKTYNMEDWIVYLINRYLEPRGYVLNGELEAQGEERGDNWRIKVTDNVVKVNHDSLVRVGGVYATVNYGKAPKLPSLVKPSSKKKVTKTEDTTIKIECKRERGNGKLWISQESVVSQLKQQLNLMTGSSKEVIHIKVILKHLIEQYENL